MTQLYRAQQPLLTIRRHASTDAAAIWGVMADQYETKLDDSLINDLVNLFPTIAPRDIKMLLRLALRIAKSRSEALSIDIFRQCAMFRAIHMVASG